MTRKFSGHPFPNPYGPRDIDGPIAPADVKMITVPLLPHGMAPGKVWVIFPDDGGAPLLWTRPCPFPVDDGTVVEYHLQAETIQRAK